MHSERGTRTLESQAGFPGKLEYLEWRGQAIAPRPPATRRSALVVAMEGCIAYERVLGERLLAGFGRIEGLRLYGPSGMDGRVPTFAFTVDGHSPGAIAETLARQHIHAWS